MSVNLESKFVVSQKALQHITSFSVHRKIDSNNNGERVQVTGRVMPFSCFPFLHGKVVVIQATLDTALINNFASFTSAVFFPASFVSSASSGKQNRQLLIIGKGLERDGDCDIAVRRLNGALLLFCYAVDNKQRNGGHDLKIIRTEPKIILRLSSLAVSPDGERGGALK